MRDVVASTHPRPARWPTDGARSTAPIRAVLFDVDGTLYHQFPVRVLMTLELVSLVVTLRSFAAARRVWAAIAGFRFVREQLRATLGEESLRRLQYVETARRVQADPVKVERWVEEWIERRPLRYLRLARRSGISQLLHGLAAQGIRTGVLSDYPAAAKLRALDLDDRFSVVLCATDPDVNAFKPNPAGFLKACQQWGLPPEQVLYVGDRPDVDATGAEAAGMPCAIVSAFDWLRGLFRPGRYVAVPFYARLQRVLDLHG